jgi:4-hydroxybenzoate polyprenyltransferase
MMANSSSRIYHNLAISRKETLSSTSNFLFNYKLHSNRLFSKSNGTLTEKHGDLYKDQNSTWVDKYAPSSMQPYLKLIRVDRPSGTWLLLCPALSGLALATPAGFLPSWYHLIQFSIGALTMRSAGCTINDMWDRNFDGKVARTALRPLASKKLSMTNAFVFLSFQLSLGLGLLLQLNLDTIALGILSIPIITIYPLLKRVTYFPQVFLGVAMNFGLLMGWSSILGSQVHVSEGILELLQNYMHVEVGEGTRGFLQTLHDSFPLIKVPFESLAAVNLTHVSEWAPVLPFYIGSIAWTVVYDTLYAHQDKHDDAKLGLKSTALWMGARSRSILTGCTALAAGGWLLTGHLLGLAFPFYLSTLGATAHMLWQVRTANFEDRKNLADRFAANKWVGIVLLAGIVAGKALQEPDQANYLRGMEDGKGKARV